VSGGLVDGYHTVLNGHAGAQKMEFVHHLIAREFPLDQAAEFLKLLRGNTRLAGDFLIVKLRHVRAPSNLRWRHDFDGGQMQ